MTITNDEELVEAAEKAGQLLQSIHDYCKKNNKIIADYPEAKVEFPRGFIRKAAYQRDRFPFIMCDELKSNLAYTLILSDVVMWLIVRTDISGIAKDMLHKLFMFLIATVVESTTKSYLKGFCSKNYKDRTKYLLENNIIDADLKSELDWLWDVRNNMHLFQLQEREYKNEYGVESHLKCIKTFRKLLAALREKGALQTY